MLRSSNNGPTLSGRTGFCVGRKRVAIPSHGNAFYFLDAHAFTPHHNAGDAGDNAAHGDKSARGPGRALDAVVVPHVEAKEDLEKRIGGVVPDDKVHLPRLGGRGTDAGRRRVGDFACGNGHSGVVWAADKRRRVRLLGQLVRAGETKPTAVYASKASQANVPARRPADSPPCPPVDVSETPWSQSKARHAEEGIEDLRVVLDPLPARGVDVIAGWYAHGWRSVAKEEKEHAAPGDNVESVQGDEEARRLDDPLAEALETDGEGSRPWQFWGWKIAIGVSA